MHFKFNEVIMSNGPLFTKHIDYYSYLHNYEKLMHKLELKIRKKMARADQRGAGQVLRAGGSSQSQTINI